MTTTSKKLIRRKTKSVVHGGVKRMEIFDFPQTNHFKPFVPTTLPNVECMLNHYGVRVRYNVIKKRCDYDIPGMSTSLDNRENSSITHLISLAALNGLNTTAIPAYIDAISAANEYNPVLDWVNSKPWDGQDRMEAFADTLQVEEGYPQELKQAIIRKWLRSAAAALYKKGFHSRGVLTLQGSQGLGKTSWVRALIPDAELRESVLKVDHHLDASDKDSKILAASHWIVEIGELESSLKKDIARLKGFITDDTDKIRRPYAKAESEYPRRTVFCATVNDAQFLVDPTGNSRFWTLPVTQVNYLHTVDMQQVFAQAKHEVDEGAIWWLDSEEEAMLTAVNKQHRAVSAIRELLLAVILEPGHPQADKPKKLSAIQLLSEVMGNKGAPTNQQCKEAGQVLRELYGEPTKSGGAMKWPVVLRKGNPYELHAASATDLIHDDEDF
jgi:putative DNA primase/helicase